MFGSHRDKPQWPQRPGTSACYLTADDPDAVIAAAVAAGGELLTPPADQDFGGRMGAVRDPQGNLWSIGSYRPS